MAESVVLVGAVSPSAFCSNNFTVKKGMVSAPTWDGVLDTTMLVTSKSWDIYIYMVVSENSVPLNS